MNTTVAKIVDIMFQNTEMTEDVQAVHDEVMRNCQDRFDDLRAQGKTEDEAIACVIESLKGMEEVVAGYPKKAAEQPEARDENGESVFRFRQETVARVRYDVRDGDLRTERIGGDEVVVRYDAEDCPNLAVRQEGDALIVESKPANANGGGGWGWLASLLIHDHNCGTITLGVPDGKALALVAHTTSGDIDVRDITLTEAEIGSTSGDVTMTLSPGGLSRRVHVNTASGDVKLALAAEQIFARSMSGDMCLRCDCAHVEATSVSGDVELDGRCERAELKSVSGNIRLQSRDAGLREVAANTTSGDVCLTLPTETASVHLVANTVSGWMRNGFTDNGPDSQVRVNAHTVSGNVEVRRA